MEENATITTAEVVDKVVDQLIVEKGLENLPDDKFDEFDKASKKKDVDLEELQDIVADAEIDKEKIVSEAVESFREEVRGLELNKKEEA